METRPKPATKFSQSITAKAIVIGVLILLMLIPSFMIQNLIEERQQRSEETIGKINEKWSQAQSLEGVVLSVPYIQNVPDETNKILIPEKHILTVTPEILKINAKLNPEEKHYGIYKTILYQSDLDFTGSFSPVDFQGLNATTILWDEAYFTVGLSDLKGVQNNLEFKVNGVAYSAQPSGSEGNVALVVMPKNAELFKTGQPISFACKLKLNGSRQMSFIPMGKTTEVEVSGKWNSPGFIGNFSPTSKIDKNDFQAKWTILHFNRNIPSMWVDHEPDFYTSDFGVDLVETVDHYQQNMRSAKYAIMFIVLTFMVIFFVEILTKRRIHPMQYLLVGIALLLFYTLLLSFSEQIGFAWAYIVASVAIIGMITAYTYSLFKAFRQTAILSGILIILYTFLYVILQLEDVALLVGSVGLFIILGVVMYVSRKINWYKNDEPDLPVEKIKVDLEV